LIDALRTVARQRMAAAAVASAPAKTQKRPRKKPV
jgi:hypothetical protein